MYKAKVFKNGRSQAIRLPKEFRVDAAEVYLKKTPEGFLVIARDRWEIFFEGVAAPAMAISSRSLDDRGRAVRLTEDEIREKNALALAALVAIEEIGDDAEQRETLDYLMRVIDEDRLSDRSRFGS